MDDDSFIPQPTLAAGLDGFDPAGGTPGLGAAVAHAAASAAAQAAANANLGGKFEILKKVPEVRGGGCKPPFFCFLIP